MFKIGIMLEQFTAQGINALDLRRSLGLSDGTLVSAATQINRGCHQPTCEVPESFARTWFKPNDINQTVVVPKDLLQRGDLVMLDNDYSVTFAKLPDSRIIDLFVAAKLRAMQAELAETKRQLIANPEPQNAGNTNAERAELARRVIESADCFQSCDGDIEQSEVFEFFKLSSQLASLCSVHVVSSSDKE